MPLFIIIIINHYTTCNHPNLNIDRSYGMRPSHHLTGGGQPKAMVQKIYQYVISKFVHCFGPTRWLLFFFYQFIRRVLVTLSNPNSNWHHRALNNTTDYGYYWFGVTMEPSVSIPSCSGKHHSEQHPLLHSSSRDDPHRAWSIFRSTCSGRGRTKLGKEVVALRCVVEVVVEMKGEKGEIV